MMGKLRTCAAKWARGGLRFARCIIAQGSYKQVFATDLRVGRLKKTARHVVKNDRLIRIGSVEKLPKGHKLICILEGKNVFVARRDSRGRLVGRKLYYTSRQPLYEGDEVPEALFSIEVEDFVGTPWSEGGYTTAWTVHGLRKKGAAEYSRYKP